MRFKFYIFLILTTSCASYDLHRDSSSLNTSCSTQSAEYVQKHSSSNPSSPVPESVSEYQYKVEYLIKACYLEDMKRRKKAEEHFLCLVVGRIKKDEKLFFEISSQDSSISKEFWECLNSINPSVTTDHKDTFLIQQTYKLGKK